MSMHRMRASGWSSDPMYKIEGKKKTTTCSTITIADRGFAATTFHENIRLYSLCLYLHSIW